MDLVLIITVLCVDDGRVGMRVFSVDGDQCMCCLVCSCWCPEKGCHCVVHQVMNVKQVMEKVFPETLVLYICSVALFGYR